jgi:transposase
VKKRQEWKIMQQEIDSDKLVFVDECGINCGMTRLYGRAHRSERLNDYVPDIRFERTSVISSIRLNGDIAPLMFKGALNGEVFSTYISDILAPTLHAGDIVIIDNLSVHKVKGALDPIYQKGATVMFLPSYSPDLNPIELCWSKIKSILRKYKSKCFDDLVDSVKTAIECIIDTDIIGWFKHDGYTVNV